MVQKTILSNGLTVISDTVATVETVAVGVWVTAGSRHENAEINGTAHILEHMAFKGTQKRNAQAIAQEIENVGGYLNAGTSRESTAYYARVLKDDLPLGVELLGDILQNSIIDEEEFERERSVVLQEISQSHDTPDDIVFDYFQQTAFPGQALGRPILGTSQILKGLKRNDLLTFRKRFYTAPGMILVASGNVDHDDLVTLAQRHFATAPNNGNVPVEPAIYTGGDERVERDLEQVHLLIGFEAYATRHQNYCATALLATLLGGGMSSRLFQEVREKRGLVYSIYAFKSAYQDSGMFGIYAGTAPDQVSQLIPVVADELIKSTEKISDEEVERSRTQLKASVMMGLESTTARCEQWAQQMLNFGKVFTVPEMIQKIESVTKADLYRVAQDLFSSPLTFAATGPLQGLPGFAEMERRLECLKTPATKRAV